MNFNLNKPVEDFTPEEAEAERRRLSVLADMHRDTLTEETKRRLAIREHQLGKRANPESYTRTEETPNAS